MRLTTGAISSAYAPVTATTPSAAHPAAASSARSSSVDPANGMSSLHSPMRRDPPAASTHAHTRESLRIIASSPHATSVEATGSTSHYPNG